MFIKYCVFFEDFKIFRTLFSLGVSMCTHTRQVEHQRCSRTDRVQKNHKILRKNTIFNEHPVLAIEILCIRLRSAREITNFDMNDINILLSLFADDCSIFLKYCSDSLGNTIGILNDFF